jgi:large subunit ribosomal protein L9
MAKNVELLLLETVENLGIVGDVVKVKPGFARNYLLPMGVAQPPSPAKIELLKEDRARAQAEMEARRSEQEGIVAKLAGLELAMARSCNDQGALYGSVTQRDISDALIVNGFGVSPADVRLDHPIRRIGPYPVPIQFDKELRAEITVLVKPDRDLEGFDTRGNALEREETDHTDEEDDDDRRRRRRKEREREEEFLDL